MTLRNRGSSPCRRTSTSGVMLTTCRSLPNPETVGATPKVASPCAAAIRTRTETVALPLTLTEVGRRRATVRNRSLLAPLISMSSVRTTLVTFKISIGPKRVTLGGSTSTAVTL